MAEEISCWMPLDYMRTFLVSGNDIPAYDLAETGKFAYASV